VVLVVPIITSEELPEPTSAVKAFFVEPAAPPPPPPPPPPPAPKAATTQPRPMSTPAPTENKFTAPVEVPDQIKPEEGIDLGVEGGVPGGVEGGVPGGVVGGVVGGLPDAPPPTQAVRVGGQIKEPKKLKNVAPVYPDIAKQARVQGVVILECTISPQGKVTNVTVLRGIPLLDAAAIEAVKQWVYSPTLLNGVPVPVIMTVTVNFRLS
jgi:periplasmic protein TonB